MLAKEIWVETLIVFFNIVGVGHIRISKYDTLVLGESHSKKKALNNFIAFMPVIKIFKNKQKL